MSRRKVSRSLRELLCVSVGRSSVFWLSKNDVVSLVCKMSLREKKGNRAKYLAQQLPMTKTLDVIK